MFSDPDSTRFAKDFKWRSLVHLVRAREGERGSDLKGPGSDGSVCWKEVQLREFDDLKRCVRVSRTGDAD